MKVELIYDANCPNVAATRSLLITAFGKTGLSARWREWERHSEDSPAYVRSYGSPTILIDGKDVAAYSPGQDADTCRLYRNAQGKLAGSPTLESICSALLRAGGESGAIAASGSSLFDRAKVDSTSLPAIGAALWAMVACPVCLAPFYLAAAGALGLALKDITPILLPVTLILLFLAIWSLWARTRRTGRVTPFWLGAAGSGLVLAGTFVLYSDWPTLSGAALLVISTLFGRPKPASTDLVSCSVCAKDETRAAGGTP